MGMEDREMTMTAKFDAHQYTIDQGWDYESIELTAQNGVASEDRENIEEVFGKDASDDAVDALYAYCVERVKEVK